MRPCLCTKKKCVQFHPQVNSEAIDNNGWYIQCNHLKCTERLLKDEAEDKRVNTFKLLSSNLVSFDLVFRFLLIFRRNSANTILKTFGKIQIKTFLKFLSICCFSFVFCYNFSNKISINFFFFVGRQFNKVSNVFSNVHFYICVTLGYPF